MSAPIRHAQLEADAQPVCAGNCGTCAFAMAGTIAVQSGALDRWGAALDSRIPALVRLCALESGPVAIQLTNVWWTCPEWRAER